LLLFTKELKSSFGVTFIPVQFNISARDNNFAKKFKGLFDVIVGIT
jgi:hypothetical protein